MPAGNLSQTETGVLWFGIHGAGLIQEEDRGKVLFSPGVRLSIVIYKDVGAEQTVTQGLEVKTQRATLLS